MQNNSSLISVSKLKPSYIKLSPLWMSVDDTLQNFLFLKNNEERENSDGSIHLIPQLRKFNSNNSQPKLKTSPQSPLSISFNQNLKKNQFVNDDDFNITTLKFPPKSPNPSIQNRLIDGNNLLPLNISRNISSFDKASNSDSNNRLGSSK